MDNRDIHLDDATIKDIRSKLNETHSASHDDIMKSLMRRMGVDVYDDGYCGPPETPNQQSVKEIDERIVKEIIKQDEIRQYHEKYNIPYPMSEVKRKQRKLKRKKLKKLNRK